MIAIANLNDCRPIAGFEHYYITSDGRVFSGFTPGRGRNYLPAGFVREMSTKRTDFYPCIVMKKDGRVGRTVHSMVLETFGGPCPEGMECRHLDGNKYNCHLTNLAWGTPAENTLDKQRHGTIRVGAKHQNAKLNESQVREIRRRRAGGEKQTDVAAVMGVTVSCIKAIDQRRIWKHLDSETVCHS